MVFLSSNWRVLTKLLETRTWNPNRECSCVQDTPLVSFNFARKFLAWGPPHSECDTCQTYSRVFCYRLPPPIKLKAVRWYLSRLHPLTRVTNWLTLMRPLTRVSNFSYGFPLFKLTSTNQVARWRMLHALHSHNGVPSEAKVVQSNWLFHFSHTGSSLFLFICVVLELTPVW